MSFLTKLGQILRIVGTVSGFIPLIEPVLPQSAQKTVSNINDKLQQAFSVIVTTEQAAVASGAGLTGSQKLAAATPFVSQLIQQTDLLTGKKPKDEAKFQSAATQMTSALADILNSFGE